MSEKLLKQIVHAARCDVAPDRCDTCRGRAMYQMIDEARRWMADEEARRLQETKDAWDRLRRQMLWWG